MSRLVPLPLVLPLVGAAVAILTGRSRTIQRAVSLTVLSLTLVCSVILLIEVDRSGTLVAHGGGWAAPMGIVLVADRFAAVMLVVATAVLLAVVVFAIGEPGAERNHVAFQSVYLILAAGVSGAFLTGDLFNLFVSFELMLTASYVLITLGGRRAQVRSGMTYIVISLLASSLFVTALALLYAATGTLNMADLATKISTVSPGLRQAFALLLLGVFGIKAAIFPLFFWLPDSYPLAPSPITAIFAGLLTKVGLYAIVRTQLLLFAPDMPTGVLLWVAGLTMVVGVLGAIAQDDIKRILSFTIVSQIGFMIMGLSFGTAAGVAALVYSMVHHVVVTTALFCAGGLVEFAGGSTQLRRIGAMLRTAPLVALLFLLPALSIAGIPPFSGFISKLALVIAGFDANRAVIVAVALAVSLLTLYAMMRIWVGAFWSPQEEPVPRPAPEPRGRLGAPPLMIAPTLALVVATLVIAAAAGPIFAFSERTADDLMHPRTYVSAVIPE